MENNTVVADQNTERLIQAGYQPEPVPAEFAASLAMKMAETAKVLAQKQLPAPNPGMRWRRVALIVGGLAACVLLVVALSTLLRPTPRAEKKDPPTPEQAKAPKQDEIAAPTPAVQLAKWTDDVRDGMQPRVRPAAPTLPTLKDGQKLATKAGQRRLMQLSDGTRLYVNEKTEVEVVAARQLNLHAGQIYVEVAPQDRGFVVKTANREMTATGTHFAVDGNALIVTQGKVAVKGIEQEVVAGQQIAAGASAITSAARATHTLAWTRELMAAAETPMVPACQHGGGELIALDPQGQEIKLALRQYHIDVHIEDGFARTTIDQTYFNTTWERLEGTFYFPLPADASLSRLAMYVPDGNQCKLMEGGMAERKHAADVYETIRYMRRDPALLEWLDGSTFKMRVFPLEAKQEKRIILSYTQKLPSLYGSTRYRFAGGLNMPVVREWSFNARIKSGQGMTIWSPTVPDALLLPQGGDTLVKHFANHVKPAADVTIEMQDKAAVLANEEPRFASMLHDGQLYMMLRYRPTLPSLPQRKRRDWIVLFETSAQRDPVVAGTQVDVLRNLLKNVEFDDTFVLMTANSKVQVFDEKPRAASPANVGAALKFLESAHLVGALDLEQGLQTALKFAKDAKNPHVLHIGSGIPAMGQRDAGKLTQMLPERVPYVGVGVGKRWNRAFMKLAAERTNGLFTQINPDEIVGWRAFEVLATLNTPRLLNVQVLDPVGETRFLSETTMIAQGEEICAVTRVPTNKGAPPGKVVVKGTLDGKAFVKEFTVANAQPGAGYLPRTWAKLQIDRLLAADSAKHKDEIIALSKAMYVMSPYTSLLVLETDADYERFKIDRGRKDHWAMYDCPPKIPLVYEPEGKAPLKVEKPEVRKDGKPTAQEVLRTMAFQGRDDIITSEQQLARQFAEYQDALLRLRQKLARGTAEEKRRAEVLDGVIEQSKNLAINQDFTRMIDVLRTANIENTGDLSRLKDQSEMLSGRLEKMLSITVDGLKNKTGKLPSLETIVAQQKQVQALTQREKTDPQELKEPAELGKKVKRIEDSIARLIDAKVPPALKLPDMAEGETRRERALMLYERKAISKEDLREILSDDLRVTDITSRIANGTVAKKKILEAGYDEFENSVEAQFRIYKLRMSAARFESADKERIQFAPVFVSPTMQWAIPNSEFGLEIGMQSPMLFNRKARLASPAGSLRYERSALDYDRALFTDLLQYAPGLFTASADVLATLEAEADFTPPKLGSIDPAARKLIDKARSSDWQTLAIPAQGPIPGYKVYFNGIGQFTYERTLISGLGEKVICDGKTLMYLYPEIGLAAKRPFSRHHHELAEAINPAFLPAVEELSRGGDIKALDAVTIAIVPAWAGVLKKDDKYSRVHLLFAKDGRLSERRIVEMPAGKMLARQIFQANGVVEWRGSDDKVIATQTRTIASAKAPSLQADTSDLVVVSLPVRTPEHIIAAAKKRAVDPDRDAAVLGERFIANCFMGQPMDSGGRTAAFLLEAPKNRKLGYYVLLSAGGYNSVGMNAVGLNIVETVSGRKWQPVNPEMEYPNNALAILVVHAANDAMPLGALPGPRDGFIQRLGRFRDLWLSWTQARPLQNVADLPIHKAKVLEFLNDTPSPLFAHAILDTMQRRCNVAPSDRMTEVALKRFGPVTSPTGLGYVLRYEHARSLYQAGLGAEAGKQFRELHADSLKLGMLPPLDPAFRDALQVPGDGPKFVGFIRKSADELLEKKRYGLTFQLAAQMDVLGDAAMCDEVLAAILAKASDKERNGLTLACVQVQAQRGNFAQADRLLVKLLQDTELAGQPELWRWRTALTKQLGQSAESVRCLEKALDLEYAELPEVVDVQAIRADYRVLLDHYQKIADASLLLEKSAPKAFLAKVIRTADRWRLIDPDAAEPCRLAGKIMQTAGERELAWDYWTTPIDLHPAESKPWLDLAETLKSEGDLERADRAFALGFEAEPTNPEILWRRAQNLARLGQAEQARTLYQQIADGQWQERFNATVQQARGLAGK